jgi:hypothetical protein
MKNWFLYTSTQAIPHIKKVVPKLVIINTLMIAISVLVIQPLLTKLKMQQSRRIPHTDLGY